MYFFLILVHYLFYAFSQKLSIFIYICINPGILKKYLKSCNTGCCCYRISTQRTCLIYISQRTDMSHYFFLSTISRKWHTSTYYLAYSNQIRLYSEVFTGSSLCQSETCYYFIKYQKSIILFCDFSKKFKESVLWRNNTHICSYGLHDNSRNLVIIFIK